jgi:hypothetical protein
MSKLMTSLSAAVLVSLAGCEHATVPQRTSVNIRYQVDPARERVWRLSRDGVFVLDLAAPAKLVHLEGWLWAAPPYACPPDLALGPNGEAVVTSNVVPVLWRVDPHTLAVSVHPLALDADADKDVGFSALVYSPEQGAYFGVSHAHGSLWKIDAQLRRAQKIALPTLLRNRPCSEVPLQTSQLSLDQ